MALYLTAYSVVARSSSYPLLVDFPSPIPYPTPAPALTVPFEIVTATTKITNGEEFLETLLPNFDNRLQR